MWLVFGVDGGRRRSLHALRLVEMTRRGRDDRGRGRDERRGGMTREGERRRSLDCARDDNKKGVEKSGRDDMGIRYKLIKR